MEKNLQQTELDDLFEAYNSHVERKSSIALYSAIKSETLHHKKKSDELFSCRPCLCLLKGSLFFFSRSFVFISIFIFRLQFSRHL